MYVVKERSKPVNTGTANDKLYSTLITTITGGMRPLINDDWLLSEYNYAKALRKAVVGGPFSTVGTERIVYTRGKRSVFNRCFHRKFCGVNLPYGTVFKGVTPSSNWVSRNYYRNALPAYTDNYVDNVKIPGTLDQIRSRAWANMQPRFGSDISMINFLLELKDFKDVARLLYKHRDIAWDIPIAFRRFVKKHEKDRGFDPTVPASNFLLTYNLAIAPLLRDLAEIHSTFAKVVTEAQLLFQELGLKEQTSHYTETVVDTDSRVVPTYGDYFWMTHGTYKRTKFTATMGYTYNYEMRDYLSAFLRYWGLNGSFEAMWNAIPFSFLLDYIVKIGKAIRAAERDPNVHLSTTFYGESLKTSHTTGSFFNSHDRLPHLVVNDVVQDASKCNSLCFTGWDGTAYLRYPSTPFKGLVVPRIKRPTTMQSLNVLALARLAIM